MSESKLALLGSVNVGGNRIAMADLRDRIEALGYGEVETIAASGNVLLDAGGKCHDRVAEDLAAMLEHAYGFDSMVVVIDRDRLACAIMDNPFHGDGPAHGGDRFVHTLFLDGQPSQERFDALVAEHRDRGGERLALGHGMLYLDYVDGVGGSKLTSAFLRCRLDCRSTARNMTSLKRILGKMTH